ncbi:AAA family ATPase [uncultured Roseobacter sp.]|uniref:GumC family protein n=1 Tax=uncultured Roseobacter sp. TaxID=114847 RepID=UPI002602CFB7|nr:AAA family ATPase [uncultured Roseobacter sp.]
MTAQGPISQLGQTEPEGRVGLDGAWSIVRRHLLMVILIVTAFVGLAYAAVSYLPEEYKTRSTVILTLLETRVSATEVELETFELSRLVIETELDILRSRDFAVEVAEALQFFDEPTFAGEPGVVEDPNDPVWREKVIDKTLKSYTVFRQGESLAVEIVAESTDPRMAANIANQVARSYIEKSVLKRREGIVQSIEFLRGRVDQLGEELSQSELSLAAFIRENDLDDENLSDQLRADVDRLVSIESILSKDPTAQDEFEATTQDLRAAEAALHDRTRSQLSLMRMERSMELLRARYQTAIEKLNELENQLQFVSQGARQVSVARVPIDPFWPNKRTTLAVSVVAGLALAFIAALLLEGLNNKLWNEDQTIAASGVPNFGFVPKIKKKGLFSREYSPIWFLHANPNSGFAEALRSLITLWFNLAAGGKVVMVTSGLPNEGKSTLTVALAAAAANDGMNVLVLDLDSHRRGASKMLGSTEKLATFQDVLSGKTVGVPAYVDGEEVEGVQVLGLQTRHKTSPQDLKQDLQALSKKLSADYDLVLVDTPPVLVVDEPCRFGALVESTLLVVRWGRTTDEVLRDTVGKLASNGVEVSGTVINNVDPRKQRRYGYGGYAHYYSYGASGYH